MLVAAPGDDNYAHTDATPFGVDPTTTPVPSVFVSVLIEPGSERAPDRLAELWAGADRDASSIVVRQIDDGADTAASRVERIVTIGLAVVAVLLLALVIGVVWAWRRRRRGMLPGSTNGSPLSR